MNESHSSFHAISWNVLADMCTKSTPGNPNTIKFDYRYPFLGEPGQAGEILAWDKRRLQIAEVVAGNDIICLQELDCKHMENLKIAIEEASKVKTLYRHCGHIDTTGLKVKSKGRRNNPLGNLTLWSDKFELVSSELTSCAVIVRLRGSVVFTVVNLHLRAGDIYERMNQMDSILNRVRDDEHVIICGDFNDDLTTELTNDSIDRSRPERAHLTLKLPSHYTLRKKILWDRESTWNISRPKPTCYVYTTQKLVNVNDPELSIVSLMEECLSFDHVVWRGFEVVTAIGELIGPLPTANYPSDHLPVEFTARI